MNSLKLFFTLTALVSVIALNAQLTGNPAIQKKLDTYIELSNQKNWSAAFDLLYPKMFSQVTKQDLIDLMKAEENNGLSLQLVNRRITAFTEPFEDAGETFVRVEYTANITMSIAPGTMYDEEKAIVAMREQFEDTYGITNVKWNGQEKKFDIFAHKAIMAIQPAGKEWYIVEIDKNQNELMESLFSDAVMDALVRVE